MLDMKNCIFCKIVRGEAPSYKIWEDDLHIAFLTPYPNTEGFSVVIPKKHYPSYVFDLSEDIINKLMSASKKVAKLLDTKLEDVGRTALIFEGFGVNHLHTKLFPMHGTKLTEWKPIKSDINKYFDKYEGYISSHDCKREEDAKLEKTAKKIKGAL